MSQITKTLLAGAAIFAFSTPLFAQSSAEEGMLASLIASASADEVKAQPSAGDELRAAITRKIMDIATKSDRVQSSPDAVTIKDLDDLNRSAERAKTQLQLEKLELDRMNTELESLIALYTAAKSLEPEVENSPRDFDDDYAMRNDQDQQNFAPTPPSDREVEKENLPRVMGIMGAAGNYEAVLINKDGSKSSATKGSFIAAGFDIIDVTSGYVLLKGESTGTEYRLSPQGEPAPQPQGGNFGQMGSGQAMDLGGLPIGIF
jgi:hypothetical protein